MLGLTPAQCPAACKAAARSRAVLITQAREGKGFPAKQLDSVEPKASHEAARDHCDASKAPDDDGVPARPLHPATYDVLARRSAAGRHDAQVDRVVLGDEPAHPVHQSSRGRNQQQGSRGGCTRHRRWNLKPHQDRAYDHPAANAAESCHHAGKEAPPHQRKGQLA
eukprot:CAMPEP_0171123944 /NCGR_PEP_ID=MMETSP0766_2-20121228/108192_1 /TAXON_ID=439317 /ORGANISM="Gambierdiscus australes, Strain CAWD 149" /LENGTH=165 /DNA_ID=CAMNT_0011586835 /DNA_START=75 /DNA_END=569 /DNA_ORIENTATION=+